VAEQPGIGRALGGRVRCPLQTFSQGGGFAIYPSDAQTELFKMDMGIDQPRQDVGAAQIFLMDPAGKIVKLIFVTAGCKDSPI